MRAPYLSSPRDYTLTLQLCFHCAPAAPVPWPTSAPVQCRPSLLAVHSHKCALSEKLPRRLRQEQALGHLVLFPPSTPAAQHSRLPRPGERSVCLCQDGSCAPAARRSRPAPRAELSLPLRARWDGETIKSQVSGGIYILALFLTDSATLGKPLCASASSSENVARQRVVVEIKLGHSCKASGTLSATQSYSMNTNLYYIM